jgi:hypothetical protein
MYRFILLILLQIVAVPPGYTDRLTGIASVIDGDERGAPGSLRWLRTQATRSRHSEGDKKPG